MSPARPPARGALIGALLLSLLPAPSRAAPPDEPSEPAPAAADGDVETIEITARRLRRDDRDGTLAVDRVRPADDPRPASDLGRLLERVPGVRILRSGDTGRAQSLQLRGAGGHQVAVLLDGVPLSAIRGVSVDLGSLPPSMIESADVVRGAAGAAYGSGAQGGALRLRTRSVDGSLADLRLRGGSFGLVQGDGALALGGRAADGLLLISGNRADGDFDYSDAQGRAATRYNNDHQRIGGLLRGRLRLADAEIVGLLHGHLAERGEPGSDQFPDGDARMDSDRVLGALGAAGDALDGLLAWSLRGWWLQRRSTFTDPTGPPATVPAAMRDRSAGLRGFAEWHGFDDHRPSLAFEARHQVASSTAPADSSGEDRWGGALVAAYTFEGLADLRIAPIVRLDALEGRAPMAVPKLGAVWRAVDRDRWALELRGNGGRLFRDPGFDELYVRRPGVRGDPDLRPEDGWGVDGGARLRLRGPLRITLDGMLFAQRYERIILFVPTDAYTVQARDDFSAAVDGVEVGVRLGWGPLDFEGTWLGQHARFTSTPAAPLPDRPAHRLAGLLQADLGPVTPFVSARWHGSVSADRFGSRARPGYGLVDAGLAARLPLDLSLAVEARNLFDVQAFDLLQRPLPGRSVIIEIGWSGG